MSALILLYLLVATGYLLVAWTEWRSMPAPASATASSPAVDPMRVRRIGLWVLPIVFFVHVSIVARAVFAPDGLDLSLANALSAVAGIAAVIAWVTNFSRGMPGVPAVMLPVASVAALLPTIFPNPHRFSFAMEPWAALHIGVALVAYALLIVATLQALLLMGFERRLHQGRPGPDQSLPPLLTLERFTFRLLGAGYVLLTLTLASGVLFSEKLFGQPLMFNHKTVFSVLSWLVYGALLIGRYRYGWRGRTALNWLVAGTVLLMLAYVGSKFVLEFLLRR